MEKMGPRINLKSVIWAAGEKKKETADQSNMKFAFNLYKSSATWKGKAL